MAPAMTHRGTIVNVDAVPGMLREDAEKQFGVRKGRTERLPISRQFFISLGRYSLAVAPAVLQQRRAGAV